MKFHGIVPILMALASNAHADLLKCDVVKINEQTPEKESSATFDPQEILLDLNRGRGPEALLRKDSVFVVDANAIWFDRENECKYRVSNLGNGSLRHQFDCGADVHAKISILWDRAARSGKFESTLTGPSMPTEKYSFDFQECQRIGE
jgi:hypothetical protein